jgi:hypothetical protein
LNKSWYSHCHQVRVRLQTDKADFSTHTYQQDFHVAPNPKTNIKLDAPGKQGRYVRIQLLDKNYLSLAEVQVIGVDL